VPALVRRQVDRWPFNYLIEVFSERRGKAFYLNVRYRAPSRRAELPTGSSPRWVDCSKEGLLLKP
jgi:hypothetical protein